MKKLEQLIPRASVLPILSMVLCNFGVYYLTKLITAGAPTYDISLPIDALIPFCPFFVLFYILAYPQWILGYLVAGHESRDLLERTASGVLFSKLLCAIIFILLPTTLVRPEITGSDLWSRLTALIYAADTPVNLLPSIHCLNSWVSFRIALKAKKMPRWYLPFTAILSLLVCASTVLIKQHLFVDIFCGIAVAELGFLLARIIPLHRLFAAVPYGKKSTERS